MSAVEFIETYFRIHGEPIKLYPYQNKFLNDKSVFRYVNKSRRVGMTQCIAWESLYRTLNIPNTWVAIVSVSDRMAKDVMTYIYDAFWSLNDTFPADAIPKVSVRTKSDLRFPQLNSRIESLPNNPRTVRGKTLTDLYLDEFAHYQRADDMYSAILPSISLDRKYATSKVTFISTPLAKAGPFYKFWTERKNPNFAYVGYHTINWKDCPNLKNKIDLIKRSMDDDRFRREYNNEFVDELKAALPFEDIMKCVDMELNNDYFDDPILSIKNPIYIGVDFGKILDSTVIVVVEKTESNYIIRYMKEFKPPTTYKEAIEFLLRNYKKWKPSKIIVDKTGVGESVSEGLSELGSLIKGEILTQPYKERLFGFLRILFQDRKIRIPYNEDLINQLHSLEKKITDSGMVRYTHPSQGLIQHDDLVWALALACYGGELYSTIGGGCLSIGKSTWDIGNDKDDSGDYGQIRY